MFCLVAGLVILVSCTLTQGQQDMSGVYLSLKGVYLANNSYVDVDDIGEDENALICYTNKTSCCHRPYWVGEWLFPNGSNVQIVGWNQNSGASGFFYRNRGDRVVRLNRYGNPLETGHFYCQLPDANDVIQILHVNIYYKRELGSVTITPSENDIYIGVESFYLRCSVSINTPNPLPANVPFPTFEWFFGPDNSSLPSGVTVLPVTNSGNTYNSTLQFSPLQRFHAGTYTCRFGSNERLSATNRVITVSIISGSGSTPTPGQSYSLICNISGVEYLDSQTVSTITYQWTKNNGTRTQLMTDSSTLYFANLRLTDAGGYKCDVTINSQVFSYTEYLDIPIPKPVSIVLTSDPVSPIRPIGSAVNLTCTVELSSAVDVPVTVDTVWTGSDRFTTTNTAQPVIGSSATYISIAMVSSFGRNQSGGYICTVSITSLSPFLIDSDESSSVSNITVGVYLTLKGRLRVNNSAILITEIGETDVDNEATQSNSLQCISDKRSCCRIVYGAGKWSFPNGSVVLPQDGTSIFYTNKGHDDGTVNLNRPSNTLSPAGQFCCAIPNALDVVETLCVSIVSVTITRSGSTTAGEAFTMECSANGADATFQWFDGLGNVITSGGSKIVTTSSSVSQLRFFPLHQSHGGNYTCKASISGVIDSKFAVFSVKAPTISAVVSNISVPTLGDSYSLLCTLSGNEYLRSTIIYRWTKSNGTLTQVGTNSNTLTLPSLRLSDRGHYTCMATVTTEYLSESINVSSRSFQLQLSIPQPMVCLVSSKPNPILSGTPLSLTCSIEFSSVVDIPLSINTLWTGPDGSNSEIVPIASSLTHYTSSALFSSAELTDSGEYTCRVNIENEISTSARKLVTVGDGMFQLKLTRMEDCQKWTHDQAANYTNYIEEALVEAVKSRCKCYFSRENLLKELYCCDKSPDFTTYRNTLIGTNNFNSTQIIKFIQDWVNSGPKIKFDWFAVRVDSSCSTAIESLEAPECGQ